jgi:hypothetical protein
VKLGRAWGGGDEGEEERRGRRRINRMSAPAWLCFGEEDGAATVIPLTKYKYQFFLPLPVVAL